MASQFEELITKQLQLLQETLPRLSRITLLQHRDSLLAVLGAAETASRNLGLTARTFRIAEMAECEQVFKTSRRERVDAIHVLPSPVFNAHRRQLIDLAARYRLPAVYEFTDYVQDGGLMSYGPSIADLHRGMASYVDKILKGARPGDLPIERATRFELAINLKTAKALGLTIAPPVLGRADHVIE
jgi:putative ABC transport system substrate-binding protein